MRRHLPIDQPSQPGKQPSDFASQCFLVLFRANVTKSQNLNAGTQRDPEERSDSRGNRVLLCGSSMPKTQPKTLWTLCESSRFLSLCQKFIKLGSGQQLLLYILRQRRILYPCARRKLIPFIQARAAFCIQKSRSLSFPIDSAPVAAVARPTPAP